MGSPELADDCLEEDDCPEEDFADDCSEEDFSAVLQDKMQKMIAYRESLFTDVAQNIKDAQARYKKDYDKKRSNDEV